MTEPTAARRTAPASAPARGTVQLLCGRLCFVACGYATAVLLGRSLGPARYGDYGVIVSVLVALELAGALGIPSATARLVAEDERGAQELARTATGLLAAVCLGLLAAGWLLAPVLAAALGLGGGAWLFRVALLDLPLFGLANAYQGALYGHRSFGVLSVGLAVYALTKLAATVALVAAGASVAGALLVNALASLGAVLYLRRRVPAPGVALAPTPARRLLRLAVPMGLHLALLQVVSSADLWALKGLGTAPARTVGAYVAALNVARVLAVVPATLSGVVFASLCRALVLGDQATARRQLQGGVRFALVVVAPACALLALDGEAAVVAIYSREYAGAGAYLGLQALAFGCLAFLSLFLEALLARDERWRAVGLLVLLLPLAAGASAALVARLGALGAALALVLTLGAGAAGAAGLVRRRFGRLLRPRTLPRVAGATLVMAAAGAAVDAAGPWLVLKAAALLGLYGALLAASGELRRQDLRAAALWRPRPAEP